MTTLLDAMREDVRHTLNRLYDQRQALRVATKRTVKDALILAIFREQQELVEFRRDILDERRYRDERELEMSRDPFESPKDPWAGEYYPSGKL